MQTIRYRGAQTAILGLLLLSSLAFANDRHPEYDGRIESHAPAGCVNYKLWFFRLYRAEVWSDSVPLSDVDYGLTLIYDYEFSRHDLVWASISEMARISNRSKSDFESVRLKLEKIMQGVSRGDRFSAWRSDDKTLEFFFNGEPVGILDQEVELFLAIWLSEKSRKPELARRLLDGKCN
ncbi:MAG: hypothetical protein OXF73_06710 [Gammaproteobacteria bacterium]|nr:hypothetical protein [Gammaproteobacteria bacterium]MCY4228791.1 hypothetical protein [Gammaproteobacteria bacterium]